MRSSTKRRLLGYTALAGVAGAGAIAAGTFLNERDDVEFTHHTIGAPTPERSHRISLAQLSDLHMDSIRPMHKRIAAGIGDLAPDLLVITGDAVSDPDHLPALDGFLRLLPHDTPKAAVLGNWEYLGDVNIPQLRKLYQQHNCSLLVDASMRIRIGGRTLLVTGLDDYVEGFPDTGAALHGAEPSHGHLLLAHTPAHRDHLAGRTGETALTRFHFDALLAGHTHGGQVNIFGLAPYMPPGAGGYKGGWYCDRFPAMYVSRGIGTSRVPVRIGARPEVPVFTMWI